jgi:acyl-CoA thioesterase I
MGTVITHSPGAKTTGLRSGRFGRWADGVTSMREDCRDFATFWQAHNERVTDRTGPLWVVLGDSTGQGLGAPTPAGGYVGQSLTRLRERTAQPWRVLNLSMSGAVIRDVLDHQLPALPERPALITCGVGVNDILYDPPSKLFADLRTLVSAVPADTVLLDLPVPHGVWGLLGRVGVPYVTRINRVLHEAAGERGLRVARVSRHFTPPWTGKFAKDNFHPSLSGYRDWSRAVLEAIG